LLNIIFTLRRANLGANCNTFPHGLLERKGRRAPTVMTVVEVYRTFFREHTKPTAGRLLGTLPSVNAPRVCARERNAYHRERPPPLVIGR
jgi:hypothetical protein